MYKNLQYNRIWTLYLLFYNSNGTTSSKTKRNHSAFQDFLSHTFLALTWHYLLYPPNTTIFPAFFADMYWLENILYLILVFSKMHFWAVQHVAKVAFKQQLPLTFYSPHKSKLDLDFSQTLQRTVVPLFLYLLSILLFPSNEFKSLKNCN